MRILLAARPPAEDKQGTDLISLLSAALQDEPDAQVRWRGLRDQLITMLLAGHETTASTLSWTWYLISGQPAVAAAIRQEATDVLGDRMPGFEDLVRLPYTTMVIQEAMRLYPPVWGLPRKAVNADEIDGYQIPAGADVMISPYTLHRHPGFWPDPDQFRPERFAPAAPPPAHRYAYIPFGAGPRVCVGSHLGMMEAVLVTAMVARGFRFELPRGRRCRDRAQPVAADARRPARQSPARVTVELIVAWAGTLGKPACVVGGFDRVHPGARVQLGHDRGQVVAHRPERQVQGGGDLGRARPLAAVSLSTSCSRADSGFCRSSQAVTASCGSMTLPPAAMLRMALASSSGGASLSR